MSVTKPLLRRGSPTTGMALILVLLMLAVLSVLATGFTLRLQQQIRYSDSRQQATQAYWYALSAEEQASAELQAALADDPRANLSQSWAVGERVYPVSGGEIRIAIRDQQACFNLNALAGIKAQSSTQERPHIAQQLLALLSALNTAEQPIDGYQAEQVVDSLWEYVDSDSQLTSRYGAEDSEYLARAIPSLTPNSLLADDSELRTVQGVDALLYRRLQPWICALPQTRWQLNVNTVTPEQAPLLQALLTPYLSAEQAQALLARRPVDGWRDAASFWAEPELAALDDTVRGKLAPQIALTSRYFLLDGQVTVGRIALRVRSLLQQDPASGQFYVQRHQFGEMQ
ncbi:type II secretion system minor pseudopilin GspK [Plesiomonas shigelloides]|uniref:type II secretion system minor pseudopilin GspK n=1 Tax=Plesiomonas shigelloides TaxID=703 RepID=UPI0022474992|nr:type II secretion system minor pseudopilin GspK [Plesiomonas shigelloides]MCX2498997.1 type II secretion system minor pseudopilin GspK [Plesiomonas shigelloides]